MNLLKRRHEEQATPTERIEGDTIFTFFARSSGALYGQVVSISSAEDWEQAARTKAGLPGADVILIQEGEWDAPALRSAEVADLQGSYPLIQRAIQKKLREYGVPAGKLSSLTDRIAVTPNPLTGLVVFSIIYRP